MAPMSASPFASPEALLAHRRFLQPIVRALLRGGDGEDDVVQEALLREWMAGDTARTQLASWLARVARNLSLELVPADADVCLSIDLDEVLVPGWRAIVERAWTPGTTHLTYRYAWRMRDGRPTSMPASIAAPMSSVCT